MPKPMYRRILLKVGGDSLAGPRGYGIDPQQVDKLASIIRDVNRHDVQIAVVIGAGNIWRGKIGIEQGMERATADHMGMLATVMNALALQDSLQRMTLESRVQTAIEMKALAEPYIRLRAIRHLEKGRIVILGGGTGNPYFTTDTAAALRAMEINANLLIKATKVDAVYDEDPMHNPDAKRFTNLSYLDALNMQVRVLDSTAITLCMDNNMPITVVSLSEPHSIERVVLGEPDVGTLIA